MSRRASGQGPDRQRLKSASQDRLLSIRCSRRTATMMLGVSVFGVVVFALASAAAARVSSATPLVVPCADITPPAPVPGQDGTRLALGVIAVPTVYAAQGAAHVDGYGRWTYWHKVGMGVRSGTFTVTVTVPAPWRTRAAITWGNSQRIVSSVRFNGCGSTALAAEWNGYVGGFYLRASSACVPLVFSRGRRSTTLHFGIGKHCQ